MTYAEQIEKAASHAELKVVGTKLFNAKISQEKKNELITLYREKRRELDRDHGGRHHQHDAQKGPLQHQHNGERGRYGGRKDRQTLFELTKSGMLDQFEADLAFRAYRHQKKKAGIDFEAAAPF